MSTLTIKNCPMCFIEYGAPQALFDKRHENGGSWYCPNGHSIKFTESTADKLRLERDRLKQEAARLAEQVELQRKWRREADEGRKAAERRAAGARGQVTRLRNRAAAGLCPCCNRSFVNLQRHMSTKHAGFVAEAVQEEASQ